MRQATNSYTRVGRDYYPNGALRGDTLMVQGATSLTYWLRNVYDRNGRRTELYQNGATVPQKYEYDANSGALVRLTDVGGNPYRFFYNWNSQLSGLGYPNGITESYIYDSAGRQTERIATGGKGNLNNLLRFSRGYDLRNKLSWFKEAIDPGYPQWGQSGTFGYSGLGYLTSVERPISGEAYAVASDGFVLASRVGREYDVDARYYEGAGQRRGGTPAPANPNCNDPLQCIGLGHEEYTWDDMETLVERRDAAGNEVEVGTRGWSFYYRNGTYGGAEFINDISYYSGHGLSFAEIGLMVCC
jgi:hypothetical protein